MENNKLDKRLEWVEGFSNFTAIATAEGFLKGFQTVEDGITDEVFIGAWQYLVDTGQAWSLQGWFGRTARALIDHGVIVEPTED